MPEGPEIRQIADKLARVAVGNTLTDVWFALEPLKIYEPVLKGKRITAIDTRGKALLTHFSNGLTMYSHNQLYGVWRIEKHGETVQSKRVLRVRLSTAIHDLLLYSASDIDILTEETLKTHPFLQRVGPDVLDMTLTPENVRERLCSGAFRRRQFSGLLLDQAFLAGLGNYLRAEILWLAKLRPNACAQQLDAPSLQRLSEALLSVPRHAYAMRGTMSSHHPEAAFRFNVFKRTGEPCYRCGSAIEKSMLAGRPFFWCPGCQQ